MPQAYENAGVSVEAGYEVVKRIKSHVARTNRPGVVGGIGGFGGLFDLASLGYKEPVLISGTDGVGTKLVVAKMVDKHDTIGVDCVAMCVNDIAAQGAEPLFFLDYIACGKNDPALLEQVVSGVADGCVQSDAGLIGGETAEMPGMYDEDEYDLAGFAVGVAEKSAIVDGSGITAGDVLIGLPSTGVHSNGFSLVRKALFEQAGYTVDTVLPELGGAKLGDVLLTPTKIYVKTLKPLFKAGVVKGVAHITGGGFIENIPRMIPDGLAADITLGSWPVLPIFDVLERAGDIDHKEMYNIFNMGIGLKKGHIMGQKVLVIGSGAREHAIAHALLRGDSVSEVTVASGNPGMELDGIRTTQINESNHAAFISFMQHNQYDWAFVGPEVPLIEGLVDDFAAAGIKAFGPNKAAAQIEGSKDFAKQLMARHNIPTAQYRTFDNLEDSVAYVREHGAPIVVKADGLAAGKGVTVAMDVDTAITALDDIFIDHRFGKAGAKVVIEDFLEGQEFSLMSFVRGTEFWPMPISQDHKRAYDNDEGPNTGGMGAYSPVPQIGQDVIDTAIDTIVRPTVEAMAAEGTPFTGILYAGLIATADGPKVIEFNARFGDPETEVVLPKLTSDLGAAISAILDGGTPAFTWDSDNATLGVVLASNGYPVNVIKGAKIPSIPVDDASHVYYAGVSNSDQGLVASSGRVLLIETTAPDLKSAQDKVYAIIDKLDTEGMFYRHDIGAKALK